MIKPSTIKVIQAGLPMSSSLATRPMGSPHVNVNNIHIVGLCPPRCQDASGTQAAIFPLGLRFPGDHAEAKTAEIDENARLQQLLGRHGQLSSGLIASPEQR